MHEAKVNGEGPVEVSLSGGHSEALISFYKDGGRPQEDFDAVRVIHHKGDLTIEIPNFDAGPGFVITVKGDHHVSVEQLR